MTATQPLTTAPTVSVILTSFNHAKFLREAIESVLHQTYANFELIIWDDCSTDESNSIVKSYTDQRIKYFRNDTNKGPTFGVNEAIFKHCAGKYIAIHHSDDVWLPHKLAEQVNYLETNAEVGAVFGFADAISETGEKLPEGSHVYSTIFQQANRSRQAWLRHFLLSGNALCHPSVLIRKECYAAVGGYRHDLFQLPDFEMWIRLCSKFEIYVIQEPLIHFRLLDGERNTSGIRPETVSRTAYEMHRVLATFKNILTFSDLVEMFPEHKVAEMDRSEIGLIMARLLLEMRPYPAADLFILNEVADHLNTTTNDVPGKHHWPTLRDLHYLTGHLDVIGQTLRSELTLANHRVEMLSSQLGSATEQIKLSSAQLQEVLKSSSWRITRPLRELKSLLSQ
jgi:glycosyltransferase involved in cell wall biosynthesis